MLYPLSTDSIISHYLGLTVYVQWIDKEDEMKNIGHVDDNKKGASSSSSSSSSADFPASGSSQENKSNGIKEISTRLPNSEKQSMSSLTSLASSYGSMSCGNASNSSDMAVVGAQTAKPEEKEKAAPNSTSDNAEMDTST